LAPSSARGARRTVKELTLQALCDLAGGYAPQYISEVERAKTAATSVFIAAVDRALDAHGALEALLPAAMREHDRARRERAAARRAARSQPALRCEADSDAQEDGAANQPSRLDRRWRRSRRRAQHSRRAGSGPQD
jgi:hypothetical protein